MSALKLVHGRRRTRHVLVRYLAAFTSKTAPPCVRFVGVGALEIFQAADEELLRKLVVACQVAMALGRMQFKPADGTWADLMPTAPGMI